MIKFLFLCFISCTHARLAMEDYCWRDYYGQIPSDALQGGIDVNGFPVFIGQALFQDQLIPGKVLVNDNKAFFQWSDKEVSQKENVKILCSAQSHKFEWILTDRKGIFQLKNVNLINGGYEKNFKTYIGRAQSDGEMLVGKIVCNADRCYGLFTTKNGKFEEHNRFYVLAYNHTINCVDFCSPPIDVRSNV